jgi:hypothetical protein
MTAPIVVQGPIQDGLAAGAAVEVDIDLPHGVAIGLRPVFIGVRTLGGSEGAVLSASVVSVHGGLTVRVVNSGSDAGAWRADALIA